MNSPAITVSSLSKTYRLYNSTRDRLLELVLPGSKVYHRDFHALNDVSFDVEQGEVIGIIGQNGSGKSTLLKILASVVTPTGGSFRCNGKITAMLELGGGFNKEITGLENVYFLGALQGYTRREMEERIPQILEFAELGEFINQPVKSYSSGMYVRLAFSLAINIDPDILITDEALSVGDIRFQQKCYRKIRSFKDAGKTILLCTHSLNTVREFCSRAIWLHQGKIMEIGDPVLVTDSYSAFMRSQGTALEKRSHGEKQDALPFPEIPDTLIQPNLIWNNLSSCDSYGSGVARITMAAILERENPAPVETLRGGEKIRLILAVHFENSIARPVVQIVLNGQTGSPVFRIQNNLYRQQIRPESGKQEFIAVDFDFPKIGNGRYTFSFGLQTSENEVNSYMHWVHDGLILNVFNPDPLYRQATQLVIEQARFEILK
jgi:ABC-type polysaccharide/polyol phosphate transport system ATPase subunit